MLFYNCPVCSSQFKSRKKLMNHLSKFHSIDYVPSRAESRKIREQEKRNREEYSKKKRGRKKHIKNLILRMREGDAGAARDLENLRNDPRYRKIVDSQLGVKRNKKFNKGPKVAPLPSCGRPVQGGAPGLGKKR